MSSTYADLKDERRAVIQTLMEMDCIPAGMELFPAADEEQWEFIKRVIDDCDYYVVIIGGRYGSTSREGVSYTEKEYDYAVARGLKVLAFVHDTPEDIPDSKSDDDPVLREKLLAFRARVMKGRLVKPWSAATELPGLVALSLGKTIKAYPAVGWIRGNEAASVEILAELNTMRKENAELRANYEKLEDALLPKVDDLAGLDETVTITGGCRSGHYKASWKITLTWSRLFGLLAPHLLAHPHDSSVEATLASVLLRESGGDGYAATFDGEMFQTVKVHFMALGLVSVDYTRNTKGGAGLFWSLTPLGEKVVLELRAVRSEAKS